MASFRPPLLIGVFDSPENAKLGIHQLRDAGFSAKEIGLLTHNQNGEPELRSFRELEGNRAGAGAAIGATAGAGGGALWALGIAAGILPAIGPVIAGGLLAAVLASVAAGAGTGAIVGTLVGLGISDEDAAYYDEEFMKGRTIVVVRPGERSSLAYTLLAANGARFRELPATLAQQIDRAG